MRILYLTTELLGPGGVQLAGRLFLRGLVELYGSELELNLITVNDDPAKLMECFPFARSCWGGQGRRVRTAWRACRALFGQSWGLVILGHVHLAPVTLARFGRNRPPTVALIYGVEAWRRLTWFQQSGLTKTDLLLYISHHTQRAAERANPWLEGRPATVCHLALPPDNGWEPLPAPVGEPYALAIGRMNSNERYKGFEELMRIWPRVRRERADLGLVLIGDGDDRQRLQALAADLSAGVRFLGRVSDQERDAWLAGCRCFCLPSRGEGFGLVYLEAMRRGKPVLAGATDAGPEVVEDKVTGRTVDASDAEALLSGILDVSGAAATPYGEAGRERFCRHFSYEAFVPRLQSILDSIHSSVDRHADLARHPWSHASAGRPVDGR